MSNATQQKITSFFDEVMNQGKLDATDRYLADAIVDHNPWPGHPATLEGFKAGLADFRTSFPDLRVEVERVLVEGDIAMTQLWFSGTHLGEFMGAPATGKTFRVLAVDVMRMAEGRIAEHWGLVDEAAMATQLGLAPA